MAEQWYYTEQGQQRGPISTEELQQYAANGQLRPHDLVWRYGMPQWVPVSTVPEFAPTVPERSRPQSAVYSDRNLGRGRADTFVEEDEDPRPRRRARTPTRGTSSGTKVVYGLAVGGSLLVLLLAVGGILVFLASRNAANNPAMQNPPRPAGGAVGGPKFLFYDLAPGEKKEWQLQFQDGGDARFWIQGHDHTDVKLRVYDNLTNQLVVEHVEGGTDQREVTWRPPTNRFYRIEIQNMNLQPNGSNDIKLGHN